jgi:hypothetical protein
MIKIDLPDRLTAQGYRLAEPTAQRLMFIAIDMRPEDREEIRVVSGMDPFSALVKSVKISSDAAVVLDPLGTPLVALGVAVQTLLSDTGCPWLLGSNYATGHKKALLLASRAWMDHTKQRYSALRNIVDAKYQGAIRWISWLGFDILPAQAGARGDVRIFEWTGES